MVSANVHCLAMEASAIANGPLDLDQYIFNVHDTLYVDCPVLLSIQFNALV